jgi:hypothetical protein
MNFYAMQTSIESVKATPKSSKPVSLISPVVILAYKQGKFVKLSETIRIKLEDEVAHIFIW